MGCPQTPLAPHLARPLPPKRLSHRPKTRQADRVADVADNAANHAVMTNRVAAKILARAILALAMSRAVVTSRALAAIHAVVAGHAVAATHAVVVILAAVTPPVANGIR